MNRPSPRHGLPLATDAQGLLRKFVDERCAGSSFEAARQLGVGENAVARALAGLGLRTATATAIRLALKALAKPQER